MASTYSGNLAIELIGTGDQAGTWGATTNANLGTALEQAITSTATVSFVSGGNSAIELTQTNAFQASRSARLNLSGSMNASQYLFVPAINKFYFINNPLTNVVVVSNGSNGSATGTTVSIPPGTAGLVYNDGANIVSPISYIPNLANVSIAGSTSNGMVSTNVSIVSGNINNITSNASTFSNVSIVSGNINGVTSNSSTFSNATINTVTINGGTSNGLTETNVTINTSTINNPQVNAYTEGITTGYVNTGSTFTLNIANSTIITANLSATCTFTMPSNTAGKSFILFLKTGAGTNTATFTGVKFVGNTAPTITAVANRLDILTFAADGSNWYGNYAQGYIP